MHHVVLERWSRGASYLHQRDARAKLLALLAFLIILTSTPITEKFALTGYTILLLIGVVTSRVPLLPFFSRALLVIPFCLTFSLFSYLAGDPVRAVALPVKSFLSAVAAFLVVCVTPLPDLLKGLEGLGVPRMILLIVQFLYRYLFVITEQAQHMRKAAACRSTNRTSRESRFQAAAGILSVLFGRSYARAEAINRAMMARGFDGHIRLLNDRRFRAADAAFLAGCLLITAAIRAGSLASTHPHTWTWGL